MAHFGIISPPVSGHIHPMASLGRELLGRGHQVTYFQVVDLEAKIRSEGLGFRAIGGRDHPAGSLPQSLARLGRLKGLAALRFTIQAVARTSTMLCREGPEAIRAEGIDALLVDQMEPAGGAVAEHLGLPFVTICNALPINRDLVAPPAFSPWRYRNEFWAPWRNRVGYAVSDWLTSPIAQVVGEFRATWRLPALRTPDDSFSSLAQICQMPQALDFPRQDLPQTFHYVGPLRGAAPVPVSFPWDRLDGRPLVYASLGTLQNSRESLFRTFAEACEGLDVQLVISHGGGLSDAQARGLATSALVVSYAPQLDLLARARLTLTHAGLNTVLDSVTCGVPLVAVPLTYEQPAIARRVERAGVGRAVSVSRLTAAKLRRELALALADPYRDAARRHGEASRAAGGVTRAADLVLAALGHSAGTSTPI